MTDHEVIDLTDPPSHRTDRPYALALAFTALMVVTLVGLCLWFLNNGRVRAERDADVARSEVAGLRTQLSTSQQNTDCIRVLSAARSQKDTENSIAFNEYVIGLGTRGDIATLQADLAEAGVALKAADDAYNRALREGVDRQRDCPNLGG